MRTILLGAGSSVDAGVPHAKDMVKKVYESLRTKSNAAGIRLGVALELVIGGLKRHRSVEEKEPFQEIDIEDVYGALRMLADRNSSLLRPFVGSWDYAVQAADRPNSSYVASSVASAVGDAIREAIKSASDSTTQGSKPWVDTLPLVRALEMALWRFSGQEGHMFREVAEKVLIEITALARIEDANQVKYLEALVRSSAQGPLWIGSLNYDNAIELAAENAGIAVDLGIQDNEFPIRFGQNSPLCLAKLHGSVGWGYDRSGKFVADGSALLPALIFGSGNKLRIDGPYLDLLLAFRDRLGKTDELWVCGYSFRDAHINHLLVGWLQSDPDRTLKVADPELTPSEIERNASRAMPPGWSLQRGGLEPRIQLEKLSAGEWVEEHFQG